MALIRRISLFALAGALLCGSPPATAQGNWQQILPPGLSASYTYHFNDVYFLDETTGWIGGQQIISDYLIDALILKTTDGGRSWTFAKSEIAGVWNQL